MASKRVLKGSEEYMMFGEFWRLYQEFYFPENNQEYWDCLVAKTNIFYENYNKFPIARYMVSILIDCLEDSAKKMFNK